MTLRYIYNIYINVLKEIIIYIFIVVMYLLLLCSFSLVVERLAVKNIQVQLPKGRRFNPYKERKNIFYKCYKKYYNSFYVSVINF